MVETLDLLHIKLWISQNSEQAFTQLYQLYKTPLIVFAKNIVRTKELAEEVVEDVFVKVWSNRHTINKVDNLKIYLYVATKNTALNLLAKTAKQLTTSSFDDLDFSYEESMPDPCQLLITAELMLRMKHAVDALPPKCKMIFRLVREDGLKYKEVAEILNISINTIDAQMAIAVSRIAGALQVSKATGTHHYQRR